GCILFIFYLISCSFNISLHTFGAVQNVVNIKKETGTAVTTINDCNELTLSYPIVNNKTATAPINNAQNTLNNFDGSPLPVMAIEIVNDIESVVVKTKIIVAIINKKPIIVPKGSESVIAIIAAGGPLLFKASDIIPGFINSWNIPVPPTTVNQKVEIIGAIIATAVTN